MKTRKSEDQSEIRAEYDFARLPGGVRGKYARKGAPVVVVELDADVAAAFPTTDAVNKALRRAMKADSRSASRRRTKTPATARARVVQNRTP